MKDFCHNFVNIIYGSLMDSTHNLNFTTEYFENSNTHKFDINYYIYRSDGRYIAFCPALDITSSGSDFNEAITQFYECFQLYMETCLEMGTLIEDLKKHNWRSEGGRLKQPSFELLLTNEDFRDLMESTVEYDRLKARVKFNLMVQ